MAENKPGYDDTPIIPGQNYKVHDKDRPQPPVVTPGTASTQEEPGEAPSDAVVLFDGSDLSGWTNQEGDAQWKVENDYMEVNPGTGNIWTKQELGDCQLHVEWRAPDEVSGESQGRGNSGVFLMKRYEIQVLDCYENPTYPDGSTAGIYGQCPPLVNACRKPGQWQTYDIVWKAPRFRGEKVLCPARVTVIHNGVVVHHDKELIGPTTHRAVLPYEAHPEEQPLMLQDHGDLVRYRNIWYRPMTDYDEQA
ncbi:MAG: DUF1080 domain-containing protein [Candidatus Brocadiia bacterium]